MGTKGNGRPPVEGGGGGGGQDGNNGGGAGGQEPPEVTARKAQFEIAAKAVAEQGHARYERERQEAFERLKAYEAQNDQAMAHSPADIVDIRPTDRAQSGVVFLQTEQLTHILDHRDNEDKPRGELLMARLGIDSSKRNINPETGNANAVPEVKLVSALFDITRTGHQSTTNPNKWVSSTPLGEVGIILSKENNGYIVTAFNSR